MIPKMLFIGSGQGSWEVRGKQIGAALGARVTCRPSVDDWRWADVVILVKRAIDTFGETAKSTHLPMLWDVLDYWPQPGSNYRQPDEYRGEILTLAKRYRIDRLIGATQAMAHDLGGVYLPHHARPGLVPTKPRARASVVAYSGAKKYLGVWLKALDEACNERQMQFVVNPQSIASADIIVALRDGKWDGPICRRWKSGVKLVNAIVAGKPVITQDGAAVEELDPVGCRVARVDQVGWALDVAASLRDEAAVVARRRRVEFSLEAIAAQYRAAALSVLQVAA